MLGKVFINYRRGDSSPWAGRLFERLANELGPAQIFMDVEGIEPGVDFVRAIDEHVGSCDYFLCIIGRDWIGASDQSGKRRLEDANDFVRIEIEVALKRDVRLIPLLIDGAVMPRAEDLPGDLKPLARRNAVRLSHESFSADTDGVINTILRLNATKASADAAADMPRRRSALRKDAEQPDVTPNDFFYKIGDAKSHFPSLTKGASKVGVLGRTAVNLIGHQQKAIEELCRQGCDIRLLFVDPKSDAARFLYADNYEIYEHNIKTTALHLRKINARCGNRIAARVIKEAPTMSLLVVDRPKADEAMIQVQLYFIHGAIAADRPLFSVKHADPWYPVFLDEFEQLWASSRSWSPDDL